MKKKKKLESSTEIIETSPRDTRQNGEDDYFLVFWFHFFLLLVCCVVFLTILNFVFGAWARYAMLITTFRRICCYFSLYYFLIMTTNQWRFPFVSTANRVSERPSQNTSRSRSTQHRSIFWRYNKWLLLVIIRNGFWSGEEFTVFTEVFLFYFLLWTTHSG